MQPCFTRPILGKYGLYLLARLDKSRAGYRWTEGNNEFISFTALAAHPKHFFAHPILIFLPNTVLKTHLSLACLTPQTCVQVKRLYLFPFFYKIIFVRMRKLRNHFAQKYPFFKVILYREKINKYLFKHKKQDIPLLNVRSISGLWRSWFRGWGKKSKMAETFVFVSYFRMVRGIFLLTTPFFDVFSEYR